jgi:NTP pyrophosphatase (non-canonical NTP hydrolase)
MEFLVSDLREIENCTARLVMHCHGAAETAGWWRDLKTGQDLTSREGESPRVNVPEKLCLIHSEVSEAMEGFRKSKVDDHLPNRSSFEVELADALIRILDLAGGLDIDLPGAVAAKLAYNAKRADHKPENRRLADGKRF